MKTTFHLRVPIVGFADVSVEAENLSEAVEFVRSSQDLTVESEFFDEVSVNLVVLITNDDGDCFAPVNQITVLDVDFEEEGE